MESIVRPSVSLSRRYFIAREYLSSLQNVIPVALKMTYTGVPLESWSNSSRSKININLLDLWSNSGRFEVDHLPFVDLKIMSFYNQM